jgi:hypothetical protein
VLGQLPGAAPITPARPLLLHHLGNDGDLVHDIALDFGLSQRDGGGNLGRLYREKTRKTCRCSCYYDEKCQPHRMNEPSNQELLD